MRNKRMISFLLCIMLLVGLMPTAALAETTTHPDY